MSNQHHITNHFSLRTIAYSMKILEKVIKNDEIAWFWVYHFLFITKTKHNSQWRLKRRIRRTNVFNRYRIISLSALPTISTSKNWGLLALIAEYTTKLHKILMKFWLLYPSWAVRNRIAPVLFSREFLVKLKIIWLILFSKWFDDMRDHFRRFVVKLI